MYKHIIWDFDGTLFDTYPVMSGVFGDMLEEIGFFEPQNAILRHMKVSISHAMQVYSEKYHITPSFLQDFRLRCRKTALKLCKPYPGTEEICRYIADSGRYNYLYTHRGETAIHFLKNHGLYDYFRDFITSQSGFPRKPNPEALHYLIDKYGMKPEEALMIGDRELDIQAAENAGIHSCHFQEDDKPVKADHTILTFDQLYELL